MNYEPLDSLPYLDSDPTDLERNQIDELIREELKDIDIDKQLHPSIDQTKLKISLIEGITKPINEEQNDNFTIGGIDMSRYSNLSDYKILQISTSYTYLKKLSNVLQIKYTNNQWLINNDQLKHNNELIRQEIVNKRQKIDEINSYRQLKQQEIKPMLDYLNNKWEESLNNNINLGIEILKLKTKP
ncbi:hypothetical protein WICMUC_005655 [Wickerhamomyces mucosus]|uniref:Pre-mRNA-splicing factor SPF27 n=1 Tax=Wickerhamomyces mucosus TaxID=1378264 RepID=A0A9P8P7R5_9ASCO|nr:hypothetical protein WICMUC_005655 [Wickerhamomyces mucosus]